MFWLKAASSSKSYGERGVLRPALAEVEADEKEDEGPGHHLHAAAAAPATPATPLITRPSWL